MASTATDLAASSFTASTFLMIGPPLDFSFHDIQLFADMIDIEPTSGRKKLMVEGEEKVENEAVIQMLSGGGQQQAKAKTRKQLARENYEGHLTTVGLKLGYNEIAGWEGFVDAVSTVIDNPVENLHWLDVSHNKLTTIDWAVLNYPGLRSLYLHGNQITNIQEIRKLEKLSHLRKLSLHGNCTQYVNSKGQRKVKRLEEKKAYRLWVIWTLRDTQLCELDFIPISKKEREQSIVWSKTIVYAVEKQALKQKLPKHDYRSYRT
jgi:hypothetical protein